MSKKQKRATFRKSKGDFISPKINVLHDAKLAWLYYKKNYHRTKIFYKHYNKLKNMQHHA